MHRAPGEEARQEVAVGSDGPAPTRWTWRTIRVSIPWLRDYTLSGVGRLLQRYGLGLRSASVQHYSPDSQYLDEQAHLLDCLREAAERPDEVVILFLDEMGYTRWPEPGPDWGPEAPHPAPVAKRAGGRSPQPVSIPALFVQTH